MLQYIDVVGILGNLCERGAEEMAVVKKEFLRISLCPRCNKPSHIAHDLLVAGHQEQLIGSVELNKSFAIPNLLNLPECGQGKYCGEEMVTNPCIIQAQFIFYGKLGKPLQHLPCKKTGSLLYGHGFFR